MKCIYEMNEWTTGSQLSKVELFGETKDGEKSLLMPIQNGVCTILTVNLDGYKLTNIAGEILRQGITTDVFEAFDSMPYKAEPMRVVDNTRNFDGMYSSYEKEFGYGRVEREDKRKFLVYVDKQSDFTTMGITENARGLTKMIYSLYVPGEQSNRTIVDLIAEQVSSTLKACEHLQINVANLNSTSKLDPRYAGIVRFYSETYTSKYEQPRLLAEDAKRRRSSILEVFDEGFRYEPQGLYAIEPKKEVTKQPTDRTDIVNDVMQAMRAQLLELEKES